MAILVPLPLSFIFLLFTLALPFSTDAQTDYKNVTLGSSLTARNDAADDFWASESGDFAFGFRDVQQNGMFLLAIWFQNVPNRTIVWSANGDNLVERGSKVELTENGQLILKNTKGVQIWSPKISTIAEVSHAAMLDSGNFVLVNSDSPEYLWESFDEPTDTILPSQTLSIGATLFARYKETNFSKGRFMLMLRPGGDLALATRFLNADSPDRVYWTSDVAGDGAQLVFNQSGSVYLARSNGSVAVMLSDRAPSTQEYYHRMILEYDGVFRRYLLPKSTNSRSEWSASTEFFPPNICKAIYGGMGGGACGFNSYCKFEGDRPSCHCPKGYSFLDPDDERKGCKRDFTWHDCDKGASEADRFQFYEMANSDWIAADYDNVTANEEGCRQSCLVDCFCAAVVFQYPNCFKKRFPLPTGVVSSDIKWKSLIKIGKENSPIPFIKPPLGFSKKKRQLSLAVIVVIAMLLCGSVLLNFFITFFVVRRRLNCRERKMADQPAGMNLQCFSYKELTEATDGFKEKLGSGAAGIVYKGVLPSNSGIRNYVAVKRLNDMVTENEAEFKAELNAIGRTNHRNVVQLLGFCNEGQHRLLVYEFMSNGSLANFLFGFGDPRLNWKDRMQIALGTAKGLLYLHEDCTNLIIHCDIKPQNILLDDSFTARISDFGLAKILKIDRTQTTTGIRGTRGYVAPEWFRHLPITPKVDVYSYGVLLLEIICSRRSFEADAEDPNKMVLADWAYDCYASGKLNLLVENDDDAMGDMERLNKYVKIAIWCIQEDQSLRPTMKEVVQMLEGTLHVSDPPDPSS